MQVLCNANTGSYLPKHARRLGEGKETSFLPLKVGEKYGVYGLKFRPSGVDYLVYPVAHDPHWIHGPSWKPALLFQVIDPAIPPWRLCLTEQQAGYEPLFLQYGITALIGYDELVSNPAHYDGILDRDQEELHKFFVEKVKIDQLL